jgi:heme-degrading monooxygenase HmoA
VVINHVHMGIYKITQGSYSDIVEYAQQRLAPFKRDVPGFVSYALTDVGEGRFVSISVWERREQADAAKSMVAEWIRATNLADSVALEEDLTGEMRTLAAFVRDAV